jgi:hypothetical protein
VLKRRREEARLRAAETLDAKADRAAANLIAWCERIRTNPKSDPEDRRTAVRVLGQIVGRRITARSEQHALPVELEARFRRLMTTLTDEQLAIIAGTDGGTAMAALPAGNAEPDADLRSRAGGD